MSMRTSTFRWLMAAVVILCFAGMAAAVDTSAPPKPDTQAAMKAVEQAAVERAQNDPMFKRVLTEIANAPKPKAHAIPAPKTPPPAVRALPNANYVYPWAANVAPPHYNPGIGFNPAVNYDLPNYSQSPNIRKFVDSLPGLGVQNCTISVPPGTGTCNENNLGQYLPVAVPQINPLYPASDYYEVTVSAYSTKMNSDLPPTSLWGYQQSGGGCVAGDKVCGVNQYLGPIIIGRVWDPSRPAFDGCTGPLLGTGVRISAGAKACNGAPVRLKFTNGLPLSTTAGGQMGLPIDSTIMGAGTGPNGGATLYNENRATIPHLHGGRTPWINDGTPMQFITPAGDPTPYKKGASFQNVPDMIGAGKTIPTPAAGDGMGTGFYTNEQSPRMMMYHDHAYGTTRLIVYKGVAAGYLLVSQAEDDLIDGTNFSGIYGAGAPLTGNPKVLPNLAAGGGIYRYGIPLVIQDKSYVNDASTDALRSPNFPSATYDPTFHTSDTDPLWYATGPGYPYHNIPGTANPGATPAGGSLWMSHEYMPVENIFDPTGNMTNGRWDYGPFLIPPAAPLNLMLPSPTLTPEAFGDTAIVNGTAFPYVTLPADVIRFRVLSVGNDRTFNLSLFKADPLTINLTNPGSGYAVPPAAAPVVTITRAVGDTGTGTPAATATVSTGIITDISAGWGCIGYTAPPTVTMTGGGGTCTQLAAVVAANSGGMITGFQFNGCTGFTSAPTVTVTGSGVTTCVVTATIAPPGVLLSITPTPGAATYTAAPTVTVAAPGAGTTATATAYANTEVRMVDAAPNAAYPTWPKDGRDGGVPDPTTQGPSWIQIGNEGGWLAQVAVIPPQPVNFEYIRQNIPLAGVTDKSLFLLPAHRADVLVDLRSYNNGDTLILYNDAPAPNPQPWPINDYYTDDPDQRVTGGPPTTPPGFGPNTRTVMQIRISKPGGYVPFAMNLASVQSMIPKAFAIDQDPPVVPQMSYNGAYPSGPHHATSNNFVQAPNNTVNASGVGQSISKIKTIAPGNNYAVAPSVNIVGGGGSGATATAGLNPCGGITLLTGGAGCTSAPTVTIGAPGAGGVRATAVATVSGGTVNAIQLDEPGSNYSTVTAATCTVTGGGCTTAATCSTFVAAANTMGSITVTSGGGGYTTEPQVYIIPAPGSNGQGGAAVALLTGNPLIMTIKSITEGVDPEYGRLDIRMGSTPNPLTPAVGAGFVMGLARYIDPPTELVNDNEATVWRVTHLGVDSHALHFHLFDVQVVNRIDFTNVVKPPYPDEIGWRDTIRTNPMEDIIVAFRPHQVHLPFVLPVSNRLLDVTTPVNSTTNFYPVAPPAGVAAVPQLSNVMTNFGFEYVWHCHMLEHEENDFMRPLVFNVAIPATPTSVRYTLNSAPLSVVLSWSEANLNGATKYQVQRALNNTFTTGLVVSNVLGNPAPMTFTDTTVVGNTQYFYRVQASNPAGTSALSAALSVLTLLPPTNFAGTAVNAGATDTATLTWTAPAGGAPTTYTIQRMDFISGVVTLPLVPGAATSYQDTGLTPGNTYFYQIRSNIAAGSSPYTSPAIMVVAP